MWSSGRRMAVTALVAVGFALALPARAEARPRRAYWMVSFLGGVMAPIRDTADQRELGLGVGLRVGYTAKIGFGLALSAQYSPLPVVDPEPGTGADVVTENHFVTAALVPRFTLGRESVRLSVGAGGGGILERTRSRPPDDDTAPSQTDSVFAASAVGELSIETYLWDSGGLVLSGTYLRSFGDRELEVATLMGGLHFTFR